jgi:hypothetical protein
MEGALLLILMIWVLAIIRKKENEEIEQETTGGFDGELLRQEIARLYDLSQEMEQVDEMLIDLRVCKPAEAEKYFRVDWMSTAGENRTLDFIADGENLTTEKLTEIAMERRDELNQAIADAICDLYQAAIDMDDGTGSDNNSDNTDE